MLTYSILTVFFLIGSIVSVVFLVAEYRRPKEQAGANAILTQPPFFFVPRIYVESRQVKVIGGKDADFYENTFYLGVGNNDSAGKTLRKVQVRLYGYELATQTSLIGSDTEGETDIRHGEVAFFKVGRVMSKQLSGLPKGSITIDDRDAEMYAHNLGLGGASFEIWNTEHKRQFGLHNRSLPDGPPSSWPLGALVTADDTKSVQVALTIDFGNVKELVSVDGASDDKSKK